MRGPSPHRGPVGASDVWEGWRDVKRRIRALPTASLALALLAAIGCGGVADLKPEVALSSSINAQAEFRAIVSDWARASIEERVAMEKRLLAFRGKHPRDGLALPADVLLAWVMLDKGDPRAEERARELAIAAGQGTTGDLAKTIHGAALRRAGKAEEALIVLTPLVGKLIDAHARELCGEEIVAAALAAKKWERALTLMGIWLQDTSPEDRPVVIAHLKRELDRVPASDQVAMLDKLVREAGAGGDASVDMQKLLAQQLAVLAKLKKDAELAQRLVNKSAGLLGDQADSVAELAQRASKPRVEARTVGLSLSFGDAAARTRSADISAGVLFGLGLAGRRNAPSNGDAARLVVREHRGAADRIGETLNGLTAEGASILIAGVSVPEANAASKFAEAERIPVIVLVKPDGDTPRRFTFVVGIEPNEPNEKALAAFAKGPSKTGGWLDTHADPPSAWAALGRDAATLAWRGVMGLPAQGTDDPIEVGIRRAQAISTLEKAEADLWTTEAKGFAGGRSLLRAVKGK